MTPLDLVKLHHLVINLGQLETLLQSTPFALDLIAALIIWAEAKVDVDFTASSLDNHYLDYILFSRRVLDYELREQELTVHKHVHVRQIFVVGRLRYHSDGAAPHEQNAGRKLRHVVVPWPHIRLVLGDAIHRNPARAFQDQR